MSKEVFYTDETKLRDLTVGQLKDIILETLNHVLPIRLDSTRHQYTYVGAYENRPKPIYPEPVIEPYCGLVTDKEV